MEHSLETYKQKRNFEQTSEPWGQAEKSAKGPIFVVQKHEAHRLHYDFRLEVDGVLKSWAIPRGPSMDPKDKRLAIATEDHPMGYAFFEGAIPHGQYGAGTVMVWDTGTYEPMNEENGHAISMSQALENGHLSFWLQGKKLQGGFSLVQNDRHNRNHWLLIKHQDDKANPKAFVIETEPDSVLTGRTLSQISTS